MFVMVIAVMSIAMGVAVQTVEFQMRREREAELIFRGGQFIEAIRLYKIKYGRYPMQLKEIYEAKPRVIRKKWKDPITDSENWGIIFLGQEGRQLGQQGRQLSGPGAPGSATGKGGRPIGTHTPFDSGRQGGARNQPGGVRGTGDNSTPEIDPQTGLPRSSFGDVGADRKMGPIVGVHSTSCDEAIKIYEGHTTYCEWRFIYREQRQRGGAGGGRSSRPTPNLPYGVPPGAFRTPGRGGGDSGGPPGGNRPPRPIRTPRP
jgi:type II secretory pathway pseudopilin PulG